jgi:hypothetical protein
MVGDPTRCPRDLLALLELLKELLHESGEQVSVPAARNYLERLSGGGKVPKLAETLLQLADKPNELYRPSVVAQALATRARRTQRWTAYAAPR